MLLSIFVAYYSVSCSSPDSIIILRNLSKESYPSASSSSRWNSMSFRYGVGLSLKNCSISWRYAWKLSLLSFSMSSLTNSVRNLSLCEFAVASNCLGLHNRVLQINSLTEQCEFHLELSMLLAGKIGRFQSVPVALSEGCRRLSFHLQNLIFQTIPIDDPEESRYTRSIIPNSAEVRQFHSTPPTARSGRCWIDQGLGYHHGLAFLFHSCVRDSTDLCKFRHLSTDTSLYPNACHW